LRGAPPAPAQRGQAGRTLPMLTESFVIARARAAAARLKESARFSEALSVDIGDDCCSFTAPDGFETVITVDALVDGIHFAREWMTPRELGYKALAVNVSDLAAMGALPAFFLVTLGLPGGTREEDIDELYAGFEECAATYRLALAGGDTVAAGVLSVTITAVGFVEAGKAMRRSEARPGDRLYVTGPLGASAAGLDALLNGRWGKEGSPRVTGVETLVKAHKRPVPRVEEGRMLAQSGVRVCEDISDGLAREIRNICAESGVGAILEADRIPVSPEVEAYARTYGLDALTLALAGGEDYELVVACSGARAAEARSRGVALHEVGRITGDEGRAILVMPDGSERPLPRGYEHTTT